MPAIVGFAKAVEINDKLKKKESVRVAKLRDEFFDSVKKFVPTALVNGSREFRLPNNINISIPGQDGEMMVLRLDETGIICSAASACASGAGESDVVKKISNARTSKIHFAFFIRQKYKKIRHYISFEKTFCSLQIVRFSL